MVPQGRKSYITHHPLQQEVLLDGLLGNGALYYRFCDKANTKNCMDFLWHIYREYGKMVIFPDSTSIHKSKALMDFLNEMDGGIKIHYLLPYTPELNPIEPQ